ncbi:MAG TPA: cytochrome b/b6 domain-containing protein [Bacteroidota bacterium]|nr:cytochrome b/b6 domain-containing protein [Bacteroidota bacterium]
MTRYYKILLFSIFAVLVAIPSSLRSQTKADCLACHSDSTLTTERNGKTVSLYVNDEILSHSIHKKLVCVACHAGFDPNNIPHKEHITPVQCQTCHKNVEPKHPFHAALLLKAGSHESEMCKDCHGKHDVQSPKTPGTKFYSSNVVQSCGECHSAEKELYLASAHGKALYSGDIKAPNCVTCHSKYIVPTKAVTDTAALKIAQEQLCITCHVKNKETPATAPTASFVMSYEQSVHGVALKDGNGKAANCVDCHGSHTMKKGGDPTSSVNRANIPNTCAKCHASIAEQYRGSIHGTAFLAGNREAPVCTDCHGEHKILAPSNPNSPVSKLHVSAQVCSPCHNSVRLNEKFGLPEEREKSFDDSYHGLATKAGSVEVANCASCHGVHDILPSSDPRSRVNKANLAVTCGKCHPGANENFTKGPVHLIVTAKSNDVLYYVTSAYIILLIVTIGGMFFHNALDFIKKSKKKLRVRRGTVYEEELGHSLYVRMTLSERLQHGTLIISFVTLVITGFMLKFPDAWWVVPIRSISPAVFGIRSLLHRAAGVLLIAASLYHLYYIFFVPRGRQLVRDLMPKLKDVHDAIGIAKYNLGISKAKPLLDRFSYVEKAEYWALVWGTIVMAATGFILWFDNTFLGILGKLWWDVARTIHYYEAWLATLSIIVWHFYFVIFNPDVYPINLAFLKGTITEEEMHDEHPLELQRIKEEELRKMEEEKNKDRSSDNSEQ